MDLLESCGIGIVIALVGVAAGAAYFYLGRKSKGKDNLSEEVIKPYTSTTLDSDLGYFELVIKMYPRGRMSHYFREMKVDDYLSVKGPKWNSDGRILSSSASTLVSSDSLARHVSSTPSPATGSPSPVARFFGSPTARSFSPVVGSSILQLQDLLFQLQDQLLRGKIREMKDM